MAHPCGYSLLQVILLCSYTHVPVHIHTHADGLAWVPKSEIGLYPFFYMLLSLLKVCHRAALKSVYGSFFNGCLVWIYHDLLNHSPTGGHSLCKLVFAAINNAAVRVLGGILSTGLIPSRGMAVFDALIDMIRFLFKEAAVLHLSTHIPAKNR